MKKSPGIQIAQDKMFILLEAVQALSLARKISDISQIVCQTARKIADTDGATFVLRDKEQCFYVDEDAIAPLWKGQRFPLNVCVSGWVIEHKRAAMIEDIYQDDRVPVDAYRPTFVKSLFMVPIRETAPLGAIGNYWAIQHQPSQEDMALLQALAHSTAIAIENVTLYNELELRVKLRTIELEAINKELECFSYAVSHDLRAPLRRIKGFSQVLLEDNATQLNQTGKAHLSHICEGTDNMSALIDDMLALSHVSQQTLNYHTLDLTQMAHHILDELQQSAPSRQVKITITEGLSAYADQALINIMLVNLLNNAWKFTQKKEKASIEMGQKQENGETVFFIRDNGAGFDMAYQEKLFMAFQRLHTTEAFEGTGIGLATVARVIAKHAGRIWADGKPNEGATFYFTLPQIISH